MGHRGPHPRPAGCLGPRPSLATHSTCGCQSVLLNTFQWRRPPCSKELFGQNVNSPKKLLVPDSARKPLLTRSISHSTSSTQGTNLFL